MQSMDDNPKLIGRGELAILYRKRPSLPLGRWTRFKLAIIKFVYGF